MCEILGSDAGCAQVTNPAIDPLRENLVMSLDMYLGKKGTVFEVCTHTHKHTHTHIRTHTYARTHTHTHNTHVCVCVYVCVCACIDR